MRRTKLTFATLTAALMLTASPLASFAQVDQTGMQVREIGDPLAGETDMLGNEITEPTWVLKRAEERSVDTADAGSSANFVAELQWLELMGVGNQGITLSCQTIRGDNSPAQLQVVFDADKTADEAKSRMSIRTVSGRLTIGDKTKAERMVWNLDTMKFAPNNRAVAKRIFNAAVRGDRVKLVTQGETRLDIQMPALNQDFKNFVKVCPAVQPKKK
jgi:hypothetical protein